MELLDISQSQEIYSVSRLNKEVRLLLEENFMVLWVEGEISNFTAAQSGHWYFSLKDHSAQVRCAMFRMQNSRLHFKPQNGMQVTIKARISLYEGRGDFQLLVEHMEEAGIGKLRQAFEALKQRLAEAGLFNAEHKKTLPLLPKSIGVVTSNTGAAIRDILSVLHRRFPFVSVIIYPTLVQGELAAGQIVKAIQTANHRKECDLLIVARGGGSLEDLWPFNEEIVAYAIFKSEIPIISGVGHEIDFTIADFVADHRAPTPSAAAELATPDTQELLEALSNKEQRLMSLMRRKLQHFQQNLTFLDRHLQQQHPERLLAEKIQHVDAQQLNVVRLLNKLFTALHAKITTFNVKLIGLTPQHNIRHLQNQCDLKLLSLQNEMKRVLEMKQQRLMQLASKLDGLSPLATLKRGYSITTLGESKKVVFAAKDVEIGEKINVRLHEGVLCCVVNEKL